MTRSPLRSMTKGPIKLVIAAFLLVSLLILFVNLNMPTNQTSNPQETLSSEEQSLLNDSLDLLDLHPNYISKILNTDESTKEMFEPSNEVLRKDPYNANALTNRGGMYFVMGDYRKARNDFNKAIKSDAGISDPHIGLGLIYYNLAVIDIINRSNYQIIGYTRKLDPLMGSYINYPNVILYPDYRNEILLKLALKEFNKANSLEQQYTKRRNATLVVFPTGYANTKLDAVRFLLKLAPNDNGDISKTFFEIITSHFYNSKIFSDIFSKGIMEIASNIEMEKINELSRCETTLNKAIYGIAKDETRSQNLSITILSCNNSQHVVDGPYADKNFYKFTSIPGRKFVISSFEYRNNGLQPLVPPFISKGEIETNKGFYYPIWHPPGGMHSDEYRPTIATQDEIDALATKSGSQVTLMPNRSIKGNFIFEIPDEESPIGIYLEYVPCKILIKN